MLDIALTQSPAHIRHGSNMGQPLTRRDGFLKVTGAARYAADNHPAGMLYAVLAVSSVARGRVGKMLSSRLARLVRSQIAVAVATASSSDKSA